MFSLNEASAAIAIIGGALGVIKFINSLLPRVDISNYQQREFDDFLAVSFTVTASDHPVVIESLFAKGSKIVISPVDKSGKRIFESQLHCATSPDESLLREEVQWSEPLKKGGSFDFVVLVKPKVSNCLRIKLSRSHTYLSRSFESYMTLRIKN